MGKELVSQAKWAQILQLTLQTASQIQEFYSYGFNPSEIKIILNISFHSYRPSKDTVFITSFLNKLSIVIIYTAFTFIIGCYKAI